MKGKFVGGVIGFKLEVVLELLNGVQVIVMLFIEIKVVLKENYMFIEFGDIGLKGFQKLVFEIVLVYIS